MYNKETAVQLNSRIKTESEVFIKLFSFTNHSLDVKIL